MRSRAFPDLQLDAEALLRDDLGAVIETAQAGTQTDAHTALVEELERERR